MSDATSCALIGVASVVAGGSILLEWLPLSWVAGWFGLVTGAAMLGLAVYYKVKQKR